LSVLVDVLFDRPMRIARTFLLNYVPSSVTLPCRPT
jgi:hypothetical protein